MGNTLNNERLAQYYAAEKAILSGQSYTVGNRTLTRANLAAVRAAIDDLLAGGAVMDGYTASTSGMAKRVVFMD